MSCLKPLDGYRAAKINPSTGKRAIVFDKKLAFSDMPIQVPCGQCLGCRREKARQWACRLSLESALYDYNCWITLTYDGGSLPPYGNLDLDAPVLFMKRLRKQFGSGIRSFGCAEYGSKRQRPHYHICLLNFDFKDKYRVEDTPSGWPQWMSEDLDRLWPFGRATVGELTFETAAYTASYVVKKLSHDVSAFLYMDEKGEILERPRERSVCVSRRPGIGKPYIDKFGYGEIYNTDSVVVRGKEMQAPKFFDKRFELDFPDSFAKVKRNRFFKSRSCCTNKYCLHWFSKEDNRSSRLWTREEVLRLRFEFFQGDSL